jgi:hypothetical protein
MGEGEIGEVLSEWVVTKRQEACHLASRLGQSESLSLI